MPHPSTTYIDAAVITDQVVWSVGLCVTLSSQGCKSGWTDWDTVSAEDSSGSREPCIRWESRSLHGKGQFWGGKGHPIVKYRNTLSSVQKWLKRPRCRLGLGLGWAQGIIYYMGSKSPHGKGQFWGKGAPIVKYRDFLLWAVQKQLNRSISHLHCGLGWAEGSTS